ncbi:MAG: hypothetical protein O2962_07125 [Cyanobacteria bacterium]|nr:hypothetical protein [Cyanobacteriota bacterium]
MDFMMIKKILGAVVLMSLVGGLFSSAGAIPIGNDVEFIPASRSLGLGIMAPAAKLDVNGDIMIRGNFGDTIEAGYVLKAVDNGGLATWGPVAGAAIDFDNVTLDGATVIGNDSTTDTLNITAATTFSGSVNFGGSSISGVDGLTMTGILAAGSIDVTSTTSTGTISAEVIDLTFDEGQLNAKVINVTSGTGTLTANVINSADGSGIQKLTAANIVGFVADATHADTAAALDSGTNVTLGNVTFAADSTFDASTVTSFSVPASFVAPSATTLVANAVVTSATVTTLSLGTSATQDISSAGTINPSSSIVRIQGEGAAVVLATTSGQIAAGTTDGQFLILRGMHDTNTVTVNHEADDSNAATTEVVLNSGVQFTMGNNDTLTLIYDDLVKAWLEVARTDVLNAAP